LKIGGGKRGVIVSGPRSWVNVNVPGATSGAETLRPDPCAYAPSWNPHVRSSPRGAPALHSQEISHAFGARSRSMTPAAA
jgi:hypothetical protein